MFSDVLFHFHEQRNAIHGHPRGDSLSVGGGFFWYSE